MLTLNITSRNAKYQLRKDIVMNSWLWSFTIMHSDIFSRPWINEIVKDCVLVALADNDVFFFFDVINERAFSAFADRERIAINIKAAIYGDSLVARTNRCRQSSRRRASVAKCIWTIAKFKNKSKFEGIARSSAKPAPTVFQQPAAHSRFTKQHGDEDTPGYPRWSMMISTFTAHF